MIQTWTFNQHKCGKDPIKYFAVFEICKRACTVWVLVQQIMNEDLHLYKAKVSDPHFCNLLACRVRKLAKLSGLNGLNNSMTHHQT